MRRMRSDGKNGTDCGIAVPFAADAVTKSPGQEGVSMSTIVQPNVFTALVRVGSHRDSLGNKQRVSVGVTENGGIEVTLPGTGNPSLRLSFDEAEELATVLADSALIVRFSHGAGFTEVA
ncbi:hypothetical protein BH686_26290 [Rhodococcus erythropolis]|nr:hypothetical protein BH686_26290 [Rhodococcus erythropolis]